MTEFEAAALAQLNRIANALERLAPAETADPVLVALGEPFGTDLFTAKEAMTTAAAQKDEAQAAGLRTPDLPHALHVAGIETAHGGQLAFMVAPDAANTASTVADTAGARLFPSMTPTGGAMLGVPAMVSDRIAAGRIILADGTGFMVNEGAVDVDRADGGSLKMQTDPASGAAELVALWQNNMNALRVIAVFGAERARDDAATILDSAAAAWVGETI